MNASVQAVVVLLIVATASSYAALKLMPRTWRRALATRAASFATRSGLSEAQARRVEAKLSSGGACGSCDSCKACATPTTPAAVASPTTSGAYRRIPIRPM